MTSFAKSGTPAAKYKGSPVILLFIDSSASVVIDNVNFILEFIENYPVLIKALVILPNEGHRLYQLISERDRCEILSEKYFNTRKYKMNYYYLFDVNGDMRLFGSLYNDIYQILDRIDSIFGIYKKHFYDVHFSVGKNILQTFLATVIGNTFENNEYSCYAIYSRICFSCSPGQAIFMLNEIAGHTLQIKFYIILMSKYSDQMIKNYLKDYNIKIKILFANDFFINQWREYVAAKKRNHPLEGSIILLDRTGKIIFIGENVDDFKKKAGEFLKKR